MRLTSYSNSDSQRDKSKDQEDDGPRPGKLRADTGDFPAVRTPGEGVVESVEEEGVMTVSTRHPAHPGHVR